MREWPDHRTFSYNMLRRLIFACIVAIAVAATCDVDGGDCSVEEERLRASTMLQVSTKMQVASVDVAHRTYDTKGRTATLNGEAVTDWIVSYLDDKGRDHAMIADATHEMVEASQVPVGMRCRGPPPKINGRRWGNLGRGMTPQSCKAACLSAEACSFAVLRERNGACTAFASCSELQSNAGFAVWEKVLISASTAGPSTWEPTAPSTAQPITPGPTIAPTTPPVGATYEMVSANLYGVMRCRGQPMELNGATWANLGMAMTPQSCKAACLSEAACSFAVLRQSNGECSAYDSCRYLQSESGFDVWQKVEMAD